MSDNTDNARSFEDALNKLQQLHTDALIKMEQLSLANEHLKSEKYQSEELSRMMATLQETKRQLSQARQELNRGFPISESEYSSILNWTVEHEQKAHGVGTQIDFDDFHGVAGGNYTYEFIPTSIGTIGYIICGNCGERFCFKNLD